MRDVVAWIAFDSAGEVRPLGLRRGGADEHAVPAGLVGRLDHQLGQMRQDVLPVRVAGADVAGAEQENSLRRHAQMFTHAEAQRNPSRQRINEKNPGRQGEPPGLSPRQAKNESCTKEADNRRLEGAARRGFMSDCVKADRVKEQTSQHTKLKNCNRRADGRRLTGDDREKFVAGCLDGSAVTEG